MPNLVNRMVYRELAGAFEGADGVLLVSYAGLTVAESEDLRDQLAAKGVELRMVRNSLARRAFAERGLEFGGDALSGNTAAATGGVEALIAAAKILTTPAVKKAGKVTLKAALFEGRVLGAKDALALASMPDRDTLRAQFLGVLSGPARGLVVALNGLPSGLARVLQARADQLSGPSEATDAAPSPAE